MAGRKPSPDRSVAMSIYPPRSLKTRLDERAARTETPPAGLVVDLVRAGLDRLDIADKKAAKANA